MKRLLLLLAILPGLAIAQTYSPLAVDFGSFTLSAPSSVRYGVDTRTVIKAMPAGTYTCLPGTFGISDPAPGVLKKCELQAAVVPTALQSCWPLDPRKYTVASVPATVTAGKYSAVWIDECTGKPMVQLFTPDEMARTALIAAMTFTSSDAINAWVKAQPVTAFTPAENTYALALIAQSTPAVPVVAPVKYIVQPQSSTVAGDRPVYRLKADGTRNTTAVSGKRAVGNTSCGTKRIGTTSYYDVPILKDATGDLYAVCVLQQ